jgi:nucleoside-diphosphate kinase
MSIQCNVIHASEDLENSKKELKRFFSEDDFFDYKKDEYLNVYSKDEL